MAEMNRNDSEISGGPGNKLPLTSQMSDWFTLLRKRNWKNLWKEYRVLSLVAIAFMVIAVAGISGIIYGIYFGATHQSSSTTLAQTAPTTLTPTAPTTLMPTAPTTLTPTAPTSLTPNAPTTLASTASTSLTPVPGILIAGGHGDTSNSTEIFLPLSGQTCALADDMPGDQGYGTLSTVNDRAVFCCLYSCQQFSITGESGAWTAYANTSMIRYGHSSWVSQAGLYLLGGNSDSGTTTEIVPGGRSFTLQHRTVEACSIPSDDSTLVILTGGYNTGTVVAKYDLQGFVELLPSLSEGRWLHACGTYHDGDHIVQVVAGGQDPNHSGKFLSSTEWLLAGVSQHWTTGQPLPRAMCCMAFSSTDNTMYILDEWCNKTCTMLNDRLGTVLQYFVQEDGHPDVPHHQQDHNVPHHGVALPSISFTSTSSTHTPLMRVTVFPPFTVGRHLVVTLSPAHGVLQPAEDRVTFSLVL